MKTWRGIERYCPRVDDLRHPILDNLNKKNRLNFSRPAKKRA